MAWICKECGSKEIFGKLSDVFIGDNPQGDDNSHTSHEIYCWYCANCDNSDDGEIEEIATWED